MVVKDIAEKFNLKIVGGEKGLSKEIAGVYACDLLSWVMSHADKHSAWITIQTHPNVVAVAVLLELSCIIIPENAEIDEETIRKADEESIPLLVSEDSSYSICCKFNETMKDK